MEAEKQSHVKGHNIYLSIYLALSISHPFLILYLYKCHQSLICLVSNRSPTPIYEAENDGAVLSISKLL